MYISPSGTRREGEWENGKLVHWLRTVEVEEEGLRDEDSGDLEMEDAPREEEL